MNISFPRLFKRFLNWLIPMTVVCCILPAHGQTCPYRDCHLEEEVKNPMSASLRFRVFTPLCKATEWIAFAPIPPQLPGQQSLSEARLTFGHTQVVGAEWRELSPEHRLLLAAQVPADGLWLCKELTLRADYRLRLASRQLVERRAATDPVPLPGPEVHLYLAPTKTFNFNSPNFRRWLQANDLVRRDGERDLDFAWRAYTLIRRDYSYNYDPGQNRCNSEICQTSSTDCGGLSCLLAGTLRANGVPARALVGRWVKTNSKPDAPATTSSDVGEYHVKSEFYAKGVGWVPVDMSGAVSNKSADPLQFFGRFGGDFVTFHIDPDLIVDAGPFGKQSIEWMQSPVYWVSGEGSLKLETDKTVWEVTEL